MDSKKEKCYERPSSLDCRVKGIFAFAERVDGLVLDISDWCSTVMGRYEGVGSRTFKSL